MNETNPRDTQTFIVSHHVERLRDIVLRYAGWFDTENHAEAVASLIADCRLLLNDLGADLAETERFATAWNRRRASRRPEDVAIPNINCPLTLDDLQRSG